MKAGNAHYIQVKDLPDEIGLFPLEGVLLLPNGYLPLNVFEPRYLELVEDAIKGNRLIGIIQPEPESNNAEKPELYKTGCIGRITSFAETGDGRLMIGLQGVCRFKLQKEITSDKPYRIAKISVDESDLVEQPDAGDKINREELLDTFEKFLDAHEMEADWDSIMQAPTESLVNALAIMAPFGTAEKQALLEAPDIVARAATLVALTERSLMEHSGDDKPLN